MDRKIAALTAGLVFTGTIAVTQLWLNQELTRRLTSKERKMGVIVRMYERLVDDTPEDVMRKHVRENWYEVEFENMVDKFESQG